ncbi:MAG TPA: helix-turn-helix transcriptional regulator, partial [Gemmataceae bacterium]|nr:helix-turn-helix transcriptional regulator [Gemmataceae bacterium]
MPISNEQVIADLSRQAILRVGRSVADYRGRKGQILTQEKLAEDVGVTRTVVAHLEEGRDLPKNEKLTQICELLKIPPNEWAAATHLFYTDGYIFHELACELLGRRVSLSEHAASDQLIALDRAKALFHDNLSAQQSHSQVNALLVFYGERPVSIEFFHRYLGTDAFRSNLSFLQRLRLFQSEAMLLYGNFRRAFTRMSRVSDFRAELAPLERRSTEHFGHRSPFTGIKTIPPDRLADLGYIAAQRITTQNKERLELSNSLGELAAAIEKTGQGNLTSLASLPGFPAKRLGRIRTLLRRFDSPIQLEANLFSELDSALLREEAARVRPEQSDIARISTTQGDGLHNLGV